MEHQNFSTYSLSTTPMVDNEDTSELTQAPLGSLGSIGSLVGRVQRRASSFSSASSPWARRRSFLSSSMMSNETHLVYELSSARAYGLDTSNVPTYSISLKESQGFSWNQDLFASQFQQQSGVIYDDGGESANENAIDEDDGDEDEDSTGAFADDYTDIMRRRRRFSMGRRAFSHSMSNSEGVMQKVKVIDMMVDDDEEEEQNNLEKHKENS